MISEANRLATNAHPMFRTYGYQGIFNAIGNSANKEAVGIGISVERFLLELISQDKRGRPFAPEPKMTNPAATLEEVREIVAFFRREASNR